jgi:uncharacterized protein (DUF433 family)
VVHSIFPGKCGMTVSLVLDFLASDWSSSEVLENYPGLGDADIRACLRHSADVSRERYVDIGR